MSDTSGRVSYEPRIKRRIKEELKIEVRPRRRGSGGGGGGGGGIAVESPPNVGIHDPVDEPPSLPEMVWSVLQDDGLVTQAFVKSEIIAYLKRLAIFMEIAASDGMEGVKKRFNVEADSGLLRLQRIIREEVEPSKATPFIGAAKRSFHIGSFNWAKKLLGVSDPLKVKMGKLVERVARDVDYALILSPTFILREYGKRLLESAIPGGKATRTVVDAAIKSFYQHFEAFMKEHNNASEWGSDTLASTVREYEKLLVK